MPEGQTRATLPPSKSSQYFLVVTKKVTCGRLIPYPDNHATRTLEFGEITCGLDYKGNPDDDWFFQCIECHKKYN